jgi:hypothetical protein
MPTAKEVFQMECQLLEPVSEKFIEDGEGTPDDEAYFQAFSAVQALRLHLEGKERQKCG